MSLRNEKPLSGYPENVAEKTSNMSTQSFGREAGSIPRMPFLYLAVVRGKSSGMVDEEMRSRLALIVPHVRRAVRTGKVIDLRQAEAATFADIVDGLSPAIFLVDAERQIVHGNSASRSMLEHGDLLRAVHGRLNASDAQENLLIVVCSGGPLHVQFVLGIPNALPARRRVLEFLIAELKDIMRDATWTAAGIGRHQLEVNRWALELGGHLRTGLEDNIKFDRERLAKSNAELVARLRDLCGEFGRHAATAPEARRILGLVAG